MGTAGSSVERLSFDPKQIKVVPISTVRPNTWNPKQKDTKEYERVKRGISLKGLRLPVIVRSNGAGYEIIDGEQRWTACGELGYERVIIYDAGELSDQEAQELTLWYQQQVPFDDVLLAGLLSGLNTDYANLLEVPFSEEEINEYAALATFDLATYQDEYERKAFDQIEITRVSMTKQQWEIVGAAIEKVRQREDAERMSEGRALELICADYLAGA